MTKRELFAGMALAGLLAGQKENPPEPNERAVCGLKCGEAFALDAVRYADYLLGALAGDR